MAARAEHDEPAAAFRAAQSERVSCPHQPADGSDLQALYARGAITDTEALNLTFVGDPTPVPKTFWGGDYALTPFARYERFTPRLRMHRCPKGSVCRRRRPTVWTIGENFNLGPSVVFKIDYQKFKVDSSRDQFDLGMGCAF